MIEKTILEWLRSGGLTAYAEIPAGGGTAPFVVVEKTGGGAENRLRKATVAIQNYADSLALAAALNETVIDRMDGIAALPGIASCRLNSDYNYTDTAKKRYRYQAVFDIVYYDD